MNSCHSLQPRAFFVFSSALLFSLRPQRAVAAVQNRCVTAWSHSLRVCSKRLKEAIEAFSDLIEWSKTREHESK
jgi:CHAD domain-containing protein